LHWHRGRTNYLAGLLILGLPVALGLSGSAARPGPRAGWALAAVIVATGLALSASKGAILAFGIALLSALVVRPRPSRAVVGVALLLIAPGALVFIAGPLQEALAYRTQASALDYSMAERTDLYALGWNAFAAQPLLGVGLNNFSVLAHSLRGIDTVPHNLTIGFLAELGLAGGVLSLALMATLLAAAHRACVRALDSRTASLALGLWIATVGFAVHNQFESTIYGEQYKIMLVAVAAAAWRLSRTDPSESPMA
jgi:O-antigen ligase